MENQLALRFSKTMLALAVFALAAGCAGSRTEVVDGEPVTRTEQAAADLDSQIVSSIRFGKGVRALSPAAKAEIDRAVDEALKRGDIAEVHVAVWPDAEYPAKQRKLPARQIDLADDRGDRIEDYLDDRIAGADVEIHNMAKRPSAIADLFNTDDATLKEKLAARGIASSKKAPGLARASSALVFIKLKQ